jgi:hypothetical protein
MGSRASDLIFLAGWQIGRLFVCVEPMRSMAENEETSPLQLKACSESKFTRQIQKAMCRS